MFPVYLNLDDNSADFHGNVLALVVQVKQAHEIGADGVEWV